MPHFTVVPVEDPLRRRAAADADDYDNLEGLNWVDYSELPGGPDDYTLGSDGEWRRRHKREQPSKAGRFLLACLRRSTLPAALSCPKRGRQRA